MFMMVAMNEIEFKSGRKNASLKNNLTVACLL